MGSQSLKRRRRVNALMSGSLLLVASVLALSPVGSDAAARGKVVSGQAKTLAATRNGVRFRVISRAGASCAVTVARGKTSRKTTLKIGSRGSKTKSLRLRGRGRVRYRVRCTLAVTPAKPKPAPAPPAPSPTRATFAPDEFVYIGNAGTSLNVARGVGADRLVPVYSTTIEGGLLRGWTSVRPYGDHRTDFSADFSKVLVVGTPPGFTHDHVGVVDLLTGTVTDLTAPRQGKGFSDPVLCEESPEFVPSTIGVGGFGSDLVLLSSGNGGGGVATGGCPRDHDLIVPVSDPSKATIVDYSGAQAPFPPGYRERHPAGMISPDGRFMLGKSDRGNGGSLQVLATGKVVDPPVDCFKQPNSNIVDIQGWIGPQTYVAALYRDYRIVSVAADGTQTCSGGLPATDKEVTKPTLTFDRTGVVFTVPGPSGTEEYRQPVTGGEPVLFPFDQQLTDTWRTKRFQVGPAFAGTPDPGPPAS